jgi:Mlc titration factor MtfA (ptsG expression regulator)
MVYKLVDYLHTINKDVPSWFGWKPVRENRESYANIIVHNASATLPSEADCNAGVAALQAEYDSQAYARNRKAEYDQLNQFEMQFDDKENTTTTWVDKINEIKGRHPK